MVVIHESDIINAAKFLPIEQKMLMAKLIAGLCIEKDEQRDGDESTPPMYHENRMRRQQFLMGVLAHYLHRDYKKENFVTKDANGEYVGKEVNFLMAADEYNEWGGSHVMNQLERLKRSKSENVRNGVYDLMYDYHGFESMLLGEIRDCVEAINDPISRFMQLAQTAVTPELIKELTEEMEATAKERGAENG